MDIQSVSTDVILAPYTTYKIGGPADYFFEAHSSDELIAAVQMAGEYHWPYLLLGTGANVLIGDKGFRGLVIHNQANQVKFSGNQVRVESGAVIADLIQQSRERGLSGFEHFSGIPSTVGGALWQNLHFLSPDRQSTLYIAESVHSAEVLDGDRVRTLSKDELHFGYDQSVFRENPDLLALSATFILIPEDPAVLLERSKANLAWRAERQPDVITFPSCGSIFKKIEDVGAGRLIDQVGLKGYQIGGAQISALHANFIVNRGGAKAADVLALIKLIQEKVQEETGYKLDPEIRVTGEM